MSVEHNKKVVQAFIESMSTGNATLADSCLSPDAFTVAKGYGKFAGVRQRDTMVGTIDAFNALVPGGLQLEVKSLTAADDTVVAELEGNATTCEGTPYRNQYCMVFMLADGKIKQVNEYFCNVHADEVLWPLIEKAGNS
ncbi:MAG: nuclear transport factor 2 family protein [Pseudomonadales bacterium]